MGFMQKQITDKAVWFVIDGNHGKTFVHMYDKPEDFEHVRRMLGRVRAMNDEQRFDEVMPYYSGTDVYEVTLAIGHGARMSAPGYMDCTEWAVFETVEAADEYLKETYGDDTDENAADL